MLGRLGVAKARAFGWGLAAGVCRVSHCVCPVDSSKARIRKAGDSREVLYRGHVLFYIVYAVRHAQLGVLPRSIFRGHHNLAVAFCHMGNCGHPGSELFFDAQHGSGFSLTQSRVNDMTHRCVSGDDDVVHGIGLG